jgi:hypothetical protein
MLTSHLFKETFGAFFCSVFLLFKNFFSNDFNILAVDAYFRVELCMPMWLNHDYGDGGVVDILAVDEYFGVDVYTLIFMGEASN